MQMNIFESAENKQSDVEFIVELIITKDIMRRNQIKQAIKDNDRSELIELFKISMRSVSFGGYDFTWTSGKFVDLDTNMTYEISADELADMALRAG